MKLLKEDYGQSEELDTFVYQLQKRFNPYYVVSLKLLGKISEKYFAYEDAAKDYYDGLLKEAEEDKGYYDGAQISLTKVTLQYDEDEIEWKLISDDDLEESFNKELGLSKKENK